MKKIFSIILSIIMMITISACSNEQVDSAYGENTIIYGSDSDYTRLSPIFEEHGEINKLIFSGLTKYNDDRQLEKDLAEEIKWNDNNLSYEIKIRDDAYWHDGEPVTAQDVKFTYEEILNPENMSEISSNYIDIKNIEIKDDKNLVIYLNKINSAFEGYMSIGLIPSHCFKDEKVADSQFNNMPIGSGPYKVVKWEKGQYIELEANDKYYGSEITVPKVIFKILIDDNTRTMQLKSGDIDVARINPTDIEIFEENDDYNIYKMKTSDYRGVLFNFKNPLFESLNVRKAICYGINRDEIVNGILKGNGESAYSQLQRSEYNNPNIEKYDYNPEKSIELLEQDGYVKNGEYYEKDGNILEFEIIAQEGDKVREQMSLAVAENLKNIGIKVNVNIASFGGIDWNNLDAYLIGWGSPFDPDDHMYKVFYSEEAASGNNLGSYSDENVDKYLVEGRSTFDKEERKKAYNNVLEAMAENPPYAMIAYVDALYVTKNNIQGINSEKVLGHHGVGFMDDSYTWLVE